MHLNGVIIVFCTCLQNYFLKKTVKTYIEIALKYIYICICMHEYSGVGS